MFRLSVGIEDNLQLLNRRSPFGFEVLAAAQELPKYALSITEVDVTSLPGGHKPVEVELSVDCSLATDQSFSACKAKKQKGRASNMTTVLTLTSDLDFIDFRRIP
jgi:ATP-dependent DNA helicase HFM1/MER3